jgi:hypothetical protein
MGCHSFEDLKRHTGHKVVVACYGDKDNPHNVAVECETCYEILMDFDNPAIEKGEKNERNKT